jgi:3-dehydro-L-gulonate 2-dehydrogenase
MQRALDLASDHGVGAVALRNTNHWMRGGTYGWQAAEAGMIGVCWTNSMQNMPAWGSREPRLGNGPLVIAIPRTAGHVVLDMSTSQFSYGTLESFRTRGEQLPVVGGFDDKGGLSRDPEAIEESGRPVPVGFWKGAGLSLVLDLAAAMLSDGRSTRELSRDPLREVGLSQVFLAFDTGKLSADGTTDELADAVISHFHDSEPISAGVQVRYPGERVLKTRTENLEKGVPVDPEIWAKVTDY